MFYFTMLGSQIDLYFWNRDGNKGKKIILSFVILRTESGLNRLSLGQILEFL